MPSLAAIQTSVGNITAVLACCGVVFGAMILKLLPRIVPGLSDTKKPTDQIVLSLKIIALTMVVPIAAFLFVILGEFRILWYASPLWCCYVGLLIGVLAALIFSLFWLDREDVGDYTFELDRRNAIDAKMRKENAEMRIVVGGFGFWIAGLGASYVWLLRLASITFRDFLHWF